MEIVYKEYLSVTGKKVTHLKIEVYYTTGGYNMFSHIEVVRGYYLSVTPVERTVRNGYTTESVTAFRGVKKLIKPVNRKSAKATQEAIELAKSKVQELVDYVCAEEGIEIEEKEHFLIHD